VTADGGGWSRHDSAMLVVSLIWGAHFGISKYGLRFVPPVSFAAARFLVGSLLLYFVARRTAPGGCPKGRSFWRLAVLGVLGNTLYQMAFMGALSLTTASSVSLIMATLPVVVAVLGAVLGIERPTRSVWSGIALCTVGVLLIVGARGVDVTGATWTGNVLTLFAVFCWGLFTVGVRYAGGGVHPIWVTTVSTIGGTPGLVLAALPGLVRVGWLDLPVAAWGALLYSAVFALVLAYALWSRSIQGIGGSRVALYNSAMPVVAILVAWIILGERPLWIQVPGGILVIAGVLVSQLSAPAEPVRDAL
jgi:drug/metabolite transporter (DMT)-like permease